eukprot:SAG31_NODE_2823_length_5038_cov_3.257340_4_plen_148_part_00
MHCAIGRRTTLQSLQADISELFKMLNGSKVLCSELRAAGGNAEELAQTLENQCSVWHAELQQCAERLKILEKDVADLLKKFGEEGRDASLNGLCEILATFASDWARAIETQEQATAAAAKKSKKVRHGPGGPGGLDMSSVIGELKAR